MHYETMNLSIADSLFTIGVHVIVSPSKHRQKNLRRREKSWENIMHLQKTL